MNSNKASNTSYRIPFEYFTENKYLISIRSQLLLRPPIDNCEHIFNNYILNKKIDQAEKKLLEWGFSKFANEETCAAFIHAQSLKKFIKFHHKETNESLDPELLKKIKRVDREINRLTDNTCYQLCKPLTVLELRLFSLIQNQEKSKTLPPKLSQLDKQFQQLEQYRKIDKIDEFTISVYNFFSIINEYLGSDNTKREELQSKYEELQSKITSIKDKFINIKDYFSANQQKEIGEILNLLDLCLKDRLYLFPILLTSKMATIKSIPVSSYKIITNS